MSTPIDHKKPFGIPQSPCKAHKTSLPPSVEACLTVDIDKSNAAKPTEARLLWRQECDKVEKEKPRAICFRHRNIVKKKLASKQGEWEAAVLAAQLHILSHQNEMGELLERSETTLCGSAFVLTA